MMRVICQFKIWTIIVLSLFVLSSKGQVYQSMPQYGYSGPRFNMDSTLSIPTVCGVPTLKSNLTKKAAIAFDSCNGVFYQYNPKTLAWSQITGGGGSTDTTSLSNRINQKLNIVDTTNKFVSSVTKLNDSTIRVIKGTTTTDITLTPTTTVTAATRLVTTVYNNSGATIAKGSVIYINGRHSSNYPTIAKAQANTEDNSYSTFAVVQDDITNNSTGTVIQAGNISNLNLPTANYTDGQVVYLSTTVEGGITTTKPLAPYHIVKIGTITRAHPTQGSIELKIENGWQLDELSDVKIAAIPADSTILQYSRIDSLWHDVSVTSAIGKKVDSIYRTSGKDSIIFTINNKRYAIKDSVGGGGGGTPAGSNGYVQFNSSGSFGADSKLFWDNDLKGLGVGTDVPQTKLDVVFGTPSNVPFNYEMAVFTKDGDGKLGIYNVDNYSSGTGSSISLGNVKNYNASERYPGFEFQNINDSADFGNSFARYNYFEKDPFGTITNANVDLFNIYASGKVQMNPFSYGLSVNPRFIIGDDNTGEAMIETSGDAYIQGKLTSKSARIKNITYVDDGSSTTYTATSTDHIIIFATYDNNSTVVLPASPEDGRELIIKHAGAIGDYTLTIDGGSHNIDELSSNTGTILNDSIPNAITIVYYNGSWYTLTGQYQ